MTWRNLEWGTGWRARAVACLAAGVLLAPRAAGAQRHNGGSSPPTAPPAKQAAQAQLVAAVSSGMGPLQFAAVNFAVPAPQALMRQLEAEDDRTRSAALAAVGAPMQYLQHGRVPFPHSMQLTLASLGTTDDLDALLTVELDGHLVTAILVPVEGDWRRVGTMVFATPFDEPGTFPSNFLSVTRSLLQHHRYTAVFHSRVFATDGDFTDTEAQVQLFDGKPVVMVSFTEGERSCAAAPAPPGNPAGAAAVRPQGCELVQRWLQPDPADPMHRFLLVTGSGHVPAREMTGPLAGARVWQTAHLRAFSCQPFAFTDSTFHFDPTAAPEPCSARPAEAAPAGSPR